MAIAQILLRGGTTAEWAAANPVLAARELGVDTTTHRVKVGDGASAWTTLPWATMDAAEVSRLEAAADALAGATGPTDAAVKLLLEDSDSETRQALETTFGPDAPAMRETFVGRVIEEPCPAGVGWPQGTYPVLPKIYISSSGDIVGDASITAEALFDLSGSTARTAPQRTYYLAGTTVGGFGITPLADVGLVAGSDGSGDGTQAAPYRSLRKVASVHNAAHPGQSLKIVLLATGGVDLSWYEATGLHTSAGSYLQPLGDLALVAQGGRAFLGPWMALTAAAKDGTQTNCYSIAWTSASTPPIRALNKLATDADGAWLDFTLATSAANCNATPGSFYFDSTAQKLYINRGDGFPVTNDTTVVTIHKNNLIITGDYNVWADGVDFIGGRAACASVRPSSPNAAARAFVTKNCRFLYPGGWVEPTGGTDNLNADCVNNYGQRGLMAHFNYEVVGSMKDGVNSHRGTAPSGTVFVLSVNRTARSIGRRGTSCNAFTLHEDIRGIDIAFDDNGTHGGATHNIGTSKMFALGGVSRRDYGDLLFGGVIPPTQFKAGDTAEMWLAYCFGAGLVGAFAMAAAAGAKIHTKGMSPSRLGVDATGTIDTYV